LQKLENLPCSLTPKFAGTIYELLSAPISWVEVLIGYVGAAATKSAMLGLLILGTARIFVPYEIAHPLWMIAFLLLTAVTFSLFGFLIICLTFVWRVFKTGYKIRH
jgi:ABC-2 type transport system permease protein